jgi:1-deoxy-D-xylulose-5-phosphate synthase
MVIMAPKDENELCRMLATAISHNGPIAFRYPRGKGIGVKIDKNINPLPIGKGEVLTQGDDILILAIGRSVGDALDAQKELLNQGISATVVNCRFVKPIDKELVTALARKIPRIVTVEEHVRQGGFGSAILECLSDEGVTGCCVERIGIHDTFVKQGPQDILRSKYKLDTPAIVSAAKKLLKK